VARPGRRPRWRVVLPPVRQRVARGPRDGRLRLLRVPRVPRGLACESARPRRDDLGLRGPAPGQALAGPTPRSLARVGCPGLQRRAPGVGGRHRDTGLRDSAGRAPRHWRAHAAAGLAGALRCCRGLLAAWLHSPRLRLGPRLARVLDVSAGDGHGPYRYLILANPPASLGLFFLVPDRIQRGLPAPEHVRLLAPGGAPVRSTARARDRSSSGRRMATARRRGASVSST
jgi:hypothetical protein